jgi:endo-1,4-beta-xylanase
MKPLSRRSVLQGAAGVLGGCALDGVSSKSRALEVPSLKALGAEKGIEVGSCFSGTDDAIVRSLLVRHAAIITPEWCLKPHFLKPTWTEPYRFADADATHAFADASGLAMHGHTLFWHGDRAQWADGLAREAAEERYGAFLAAVIGRYPDLPSWDIANEVIADPEPGLLRSEPLLAAHGLDFVASLFRRARALAPAAKLVLNDYNLECGQDWCTTKQEKAIALIDKLLAAGAPIDAVGIQSHLSSRYGAGIEMTLSFCDQVATRGLAVYLSELDVNDVAFPDAVPERDLAVANLYRVYLSALLSHRAVKRVVFWGLADRDHWMVRDTTDDARPQGKARPALFDAAGRPKAAFFAVADALRRAPAR